MYDEIYVGASLAILAKLSITNKKKILVIEKDKNFGGAWRNAYKNVFKDIDLACHLIVTQNKKNSKEIISFLSKLGINLSVIKKKNFFYDSKNFRAYGKKGPALICNNGWSYMLNKLTKIVLQKKNITFLKKTKVSKIITNKNNALVFCGKKKVLGNKVFLPTYCDINKIYYKNKKILLPFKLIKNIHFVFYLKAKSNVLNNEFQGFWEKNKNNIFDRLSISSDKRINSTLNCYTVCARLSKKYKKKIGIVNYKSVLNFLEKNNLIHFGKLENLKKVIYDCPYRSKDDYKRIKDSFNFYKLPLEILDTRYMGHFLSKISKIKNFKNNV